MTLLASERSLLIRSKFRSVLQLRIQNRRRSEATAEPVLKSADAPKNTEKDQSEALRLTDNGASQKLPPSGGNTEPAQAERTTSGTHRSKKARQTQDLVSERVQHPPGPLEHQHPLPPESRPLLFPPSADVLEDDVAASEHRGGRQSPGFTPLPGLPGDQLLSDFLAVAPPLNHSPSHAQPALTLLPAAEGAKQPMSATLSDSNSAATPGRTNGLYMSAQTTPLLPKTARPSSPNSSNTFTFNQLSRPRKPKPKMKKLKYHQYIPPDQRGGSGNSAGGNKQKSPAPSQPLDPAYSQLLKQQQIFLQLQIHQSQQQQQQQQQLQMQSLQMQPQQEQQMTVVSSGDQSDPVKSSGALPLNPQPLAATANHTSAQTNCTASKPELLPANLVDLTVSELRQQLRKRGLPVSGTKPALLQRLRPFQLPSSCVTPAPLCQLGTSLEPLSACPSLALSHSPSSSSCSGSGLNSPSSSPNQQIYVSERRLPAGLLKDAGDRAAQENRKVVPVGLGDALFLAAASTASGTPSPSLPMSSSSPLQCGAPWRSESEQLQQQQELRVEMEMKERLRSRPRDRSSSSTKEGKSGADHLHPFLQQDPGSTVKQPQTEVMFTQVFCCQPCDMIGQDFELPVQITASPVQSLPCLVRSLEEELQEAIQRAQMDPRQSIDDILDEPITCVSSSHVSELSPPAESLSDSPSSSPPPAPPSGPDSAQSSQSSQQPTKDDSFMPSPLCSSLLLELPPSPAVINPSQVVPAPPPPPPPPICTSPLSHGGKSRKRRAPSLFEAADWLETLTTGLRPLTPPTAPFVESDFSLDSDLNVSRVLDLMIEQW